MAASSRRNFYIRTSTLLVSELDDGPHHTPLGRAELACCVRHPPRVAIAGPNRWLKPFRIWAPEREVTYQNGAPAPSIGVPTPRVIVESVDVVPTPRVIVESVDVVPTPWCNDSCRNSMTARTTRRSGAQS